MGGMIHCIQLSLQGTCLLVSLQRYLTNKFIPYCRMQIRIFYLVMVYLNNFLHCGIQLGLIFLVVSKTGMMLTKSWVSILRKLHIIQLVGYNPEKYSALITQNIGIKRTKMFTLFDLIIACIPQCKILFWNFQIQINLKIF